MVKCECIVEGKRYITKEVCLSDCETSGVREVKLWAYLSWKNIIFGLACLLRL